VLFDRETRAPDCVEADTGDVDSEVLPIIITVTAGALAVILLVAHFTGHTKWAGRLDERMWDSKLGWLVPGGVAYRVGRRWGLRAGPLPYLIFGVYGMWGYRVGRQQYLVLHGLDESELLAGGAPPVSCRAPDSEETFVAVEGRHRE
jgi:hypothetical protein